jgi:prepilin-type processing-associated H-X9-DG protein
VLAIKRCAQHESAGFTIIELLCVSGIIATLTALFLPEVAAARNEARALACASNLRQLCAALTAYAADNGGRYPPNFWIPSPGQQWCDSERIGAYIDHRIVAGSDGVGDGVFMCPNDERSLRSYSMNFWASSTVDAYLLPFIRNTGVFWNASVRSASRMILVTENWSCFGSDESGWITGPTIGLLGETPAERFGAGFGINPPVDTGRWGWANCELPYRRHRKREGTANDPKGRVNIGYADGHVATKSDNQLVDGQGNSTLDSLWSLTDR